AERVLLGHLAQVLGGAHHRSAAFAEQVPRHLEEPALGGVEEDVDRLVLAQPILRGEVEHVDAAKVAIDAFGDVLLQRIDRFGRDPCLPQRFEPWIPHESILAATAAGRAQARAGVPGRGSPARAAASLRSHWGIEARSPTRAAAECRTSDPPRAARAGRARAW